MPIPSAVKVMTTQNYLSSLDILKPSILPDFIKRYGNQNITGLLAAYGGMVPVDQNEYSHYEEDFIHNKFQAASAGSATSATAAVNITIAAGYRDGAGRSFVRNNDIVMIPATGDLALVSGKGSDTDDTIVLTPYTTWTRFSSNPTNVVLTTDELIIVGNEYAENTGQPEGITPRVIKYTNNVMILKEAYEVTGSAMTDVIWFEVEGANGEKGYLWHLKGEADTVVRMDNYCELMMLVGRKATNSAITSQGLSGTEALEPFIRGNGTVEGYSSGSLSITDWQNLVKSMTAKRADKENFMHTGLDFDIDFENFGRNLPGLTQGGIVYTTFGEQGKEAAITLGFNSFHYAGFTFHRRSYELFNDPQLLGANGSKYRSMALIIPTESRRDPKRNVMMKPLAIRYKAAGGYSREMEHFLTGSANIATATNENDNLKHNYRTERGFEGFAGNRFAIMEV